jgi:hypothetical protein
MQPQTICISCNNDVKSVPFHELGCVRANSAEITARHYIIRNTIAKTYSNIGGLAIVEPTPFVNTQIRPDIEWLINNRRIFLDISLAHPLKLTTLRLAARYQLAAAQEREHKKTLKYLPECEKINTEFIPLVTETFGGLGKQFNCFLKDLRQIVNENFTLTNGSLLIDEMLDQIAFHMITSNGIIMKSASSKYYD